MPGKTVLIVEDNPMNLELASDILVALGHQVLHATTAQEALTHLETTLPSLILMDIQLPGTSGLDLTRQIKADPRTKDITVVALTAHAMKGDEEKVFQAGCSAYIAKPIDTREFTRIVQQHLSGNGHTQ